MALGKLINAALSSATGYRLAKANSSVGSFSGWEYLRHNARRLEHLASLGLPLHGKKVLEVGAGIGDHSSFYLDRGCEMLITEARPDNLEVLHRRYPGVDVRQLDLETPDETLAEQFDVIHCYGVLYHLKNPDQAIAFLAKRCRVFLLLETCVSYGSELAVNLCPEIHEDPTQAVSGQGCRPTRPWVFNELEKHFPFVYFPETQPNHPEFPTDWTKPPVPMPPFTRAVFVASRMAIANPLLKSELLKQQRPQ
ncbi:MAG: methyltransferase domain-containing protein [Verrucomicrobia bacterium]|nr:methyltransferase domain-containing protein [Verrucomicrobiota bacterium]